MDVEDKLLASLETLQDGLRKGGLHLLEQATISPVVFRAVLDDEEFDRLNRRMSHRALLIQLDAVARCVLEILDTALVGQGEDGLLGAEADEMHGLGEFAYLRILCKLLEPGCDGRSYGDIAARLFERLTLSQHDASPLNVHRALYTMLDSILGENGGGGFSSAPTNTKPDRREVA